MCRGCKGPFGLKNGLDFQRRAAAAMAASAAAGAAANPAAAAAANADPLPDWNVLTPSPGRLQFFLSNPGPPTTSTAWNTKSVIFRVFWLLLGPWWAT